MSDEVKDTTMLSDNAAGKTEVFETKPVETSEQAKATPQADVVKAEKRVPLAELQKERARRRQAEDDNLRIRQEIDEIRTNVSRFNQSKDEDDLVNEAEKSLGIDREQARKLIDLQKKVAEKSSPKVSQSQLQDPIIRAMDEFKKRATEASNDYDDWNEMIPSMQAVMAREIEANGAMAYAKSPEYYYSKALKAQKQSESKMKEETAVDRSNNTSLAETETGGGTKTVHGQKINQTVWDANRGDPKWVSQNIDEIKSLWRQGKLK